MRITYLPTSEEANNAVIKHAELMDTCDKRRDAYLLSVGGYGFIGDSASMTLHGVLFRGPPAPGYVKSTTGDSDSLNDYFPNENTDEGALAWSSLKSLSMPLISGVPGVKPLAASFSDRRLYFTGSKMISPSQAVILACSEAVSADAPFKQSRLNELSESAGSGCLTPLAPLAPLTPEPIAIRPKFR